MNEFRNKTFKMRNEIEQIAAKALGYYPAYRDDPKIFPDVSPDDDTVCIGDHTTETIVAELAERYKKLKKKVEELKCCKKCKHVKIHNGYTMIGECGLVGMTIALNDLEVCKWYEEVTEFDKLETPERGEK